MLRKFKRLGALVALGLLAGLLVPGQARAAETFTVQAGQDFFGAGIQAFSARMYPGYIKVHSGDTIQFTNEGIGLIPGTTYPQEWLGEHWAQVGDEWFYFASDPDDGPDALKFNEAVFQPGTCGAATNPCQWSGNNEDLLFPEETEDGVFHVEVTAPPGTTLWGVLGPFPAVNANIRVDVVAPNEAASTQAELDQRAAQLMRKDYEDALALNAHMNGKRTSHRTASGQKVFDVWVGGLGGVIELFNSYPKKITVPQGARVQYHFMSDIEPHTATFGGPKAREMLETGIFPFCDPDGDEGAGPDTMPTFGDQGPVCPENSIVEFDIDPRMIDEIGDGRVTGGQDYENSGLKMPLYPDGSSFDANPWTVRMTKPSGDKGFKYICLLHGGFMGGRVVVR